MQWRNDYDSGVTYAKDDVVLYNSEVYIALRETDKLPTSAGQWIKISSTSGGGGGSDPLHLDNYLSVGATPAQSGAVRLGYASELVWRSEDDSIDLFTLGLNNPPPNAGMGSDWLSWTIPTWIYGGLALGDNPSIQGILNLGNNQFIYSRNAANSDDILVIGLQGVDNQIKIGPSGHLFDGSDSGQYLNLANEMITIDWAAGIMTMDGTLNLDNEFMLLKERADPSAPAVNKAALYAKDNGGGKTQLVVRFNTGAVQVIATEP